MNTKKFTLSLGDEKIEFFGVYFLREQHLADKIKANFIFYWSLVRGSQVNGTILIKMDITL